MKKLKNIIITITIINIILIITSNKVNAALQSNGDWPATATIPNWMWYVRNMQASGGTLGRRDVINNDLTATTETDLDIHMEKNTEYGAMALLSASQYGKPNKVEDGDTTTGNSTGVVMKINHEWVAASVEGFVGGSYWSSSVSRYKNVYPGVGGFTGSTTYSNYLAPYAEKKGDAVLSWHSSGAAQWLACSKTYHNTNAYTGGLIRSYSGSIFSYYGYGNNSWWWGGTSGHPVNDVYDAYYSKSWATRAVIVNGEGL